MQIYFILLYLYYTFVGIMKSRITISHFSHSFAGLLLLIFASYYANVTLCNHYHVVDGVTIVHSHFHTSDHTSDPVSSNHTDNELTLINELQNFVAEAQSSDFNIEIVTTHHYSVLGGSGVQQVCPACTVSSHLRGPPAGHRIG